MSALFDLRGHTALVTGAAGGLGAAIALALGDHGADVVAADRDATRCAELVRTLRERGRSAHAVGGDLADRAAVERLATAATDIAPLDILVCNAGIPGHAGPMGALTDADWDEVLTVNLRSAHWLCSRLVPPMAARGRGSVILMSSIAGLRGNRSIGLYGLSKAALAQLARNLAIEWGPRGVRVNAIAPGLIRTPLSKGLMGDEEFMRRRLAATPLRRVGEPEEVAGVAVMLASAAGAFVTGQNIVVDGGTLVSDGS